MVQELKPCPFCGQQPVLEYDPSRAWQGTMGRYVRCDGDDCPCVVVLGRTFRTDEEAIAAWNRRADALERERVLRELLRRWRNTHACDDSGKHYRCQVCEDTDAALAQ